MKKNDNKDEAKPSFAVRDKRFWQQEESGSEESVQDIAKPAYVVQLEAQLKDRDQAYAELASALRLQREEHKAIKERMQREQESLTTQSLIKLLQPLLEVLDNLHLSLKTLPDLADNQSSKSGLKLIIQQFERSLNELGVEKTQTVQCPFNPDLAEAISISECSDQAMDNLVVEEYRAGFTLRGKLIRPARVRVAKWSQDATKPQHPQS